MCFQYEQPGKVCLGTTLKMMQDILTCMSYVLYYMESCCQSLEDPVYKSGHVIIVYMQ